MVAWDAATKFNVTTNPARAREILEERIEIGRKSAMGLFERINTEVPKDSIAKGKALQFGVVGARGFGVFYGDEQRGIHRHALAQFAQRAGVPGQYLAELAEGADGWQRELGAEILNRHYQRGEEHTRYLVRAVKGEVRGFLSDHYRRLDSRPLAEALADEAAKIGAVPVEGTASDTRVAMKVLLPQIFEPVSGEVVAFGLEWGNSDFGAAKHSIRAFMLRVWCLNGATMENSLAQVHLGRGLTDDIELSRRTYELDTRASISALRDVVQGTLAPKKVEALCAGIQRAHDNEVEWKDVKTGLAKKLLKSELEEARKAFESEDVYNLPAGHTMWRASNAISWIAGQKDVDPDRKLELQRLAGELVDGRKDAEIKEAA